MFNKMSDTYANPLLPRVCHTYPIAALRTLDLLPSCPAKYALPLRVQHAPMTPALVRR